MTHPTPDRLFLDFQEAVAGRYSLERELGRGGMGVVYLAREVRLDRPVAIKLLPPGKAADPKLRERFLREARTAAKLSHPNIIPLHAVEELGQFVFFVMAYVEGETLTARVRRTGPLAPSEAARILRDVAWALAYAHTQGVIHRDVKPDNILLESMGRGGRVLVADFGIAGVVTGAGALDGGEVIGTPEFMSPEQALGERVDARSDMYALGVVGFFILSGRLPFEADTPTEVLAKQVTEPAPALARLAPHVPRRLARAIDGCLAKDPVERPPDGGMVADQLGMEQRRDVPPALRVFVRSCRSVGLGLAFLLLYLSFILAVVGAALVGPIGGFAGFFGVVIGGPLLFLGWQARRVARLGYGQHDVDWAFQAELERSREERAFEYGMRASRFERGWQAVALFGTVVGFLGMTVGAGVVTTLGGVLFSVGGLTAIIVIARAQRRSDYGGSLWHKFWKGRVGGWLLRKAAQFGVTQAAQGVTSRPTELALGMAAEQLYEQLPKASRRELKDLPDVVRRLETDAQRMRTRLEELQEALGGAGRTAADPAIHERHNRIVADLSAERDQVQQRLRDTVAALETIRLNLLRLHAGTGSVQSLTTDLGLARDLGREIDLQVEAYREIEGAPRPGR